MKTDLYIDTPLIENEELHKKALEETHQGSITPTTLSSRKFLKDIPTASYYIDKYKYADNAVTHYAINSEEINVITEDNKVLGELVELVKVKEEPQSVKSSVYKAEDAKKVMHHHLEKEVLTKALNYLLDNNDHTVLVDIFARDIHKIKILEVGRGAKNYIPETHTVVLYKNPPIEGKHEISVIDPSNFLFSSHLSNSDIEFKHDAFSRITTLHKTLQIYKAGDPKNIGANKDQYRDCVDIAVKLAFGFNKMTWPVIDLKKIGESYIVKAISNLGEIDKSFPDTNVAKGLAIRIKQASDIKTILTFYKVEQVINKSLDTIETFSKAISLQREKDYRQLLSNTESSNLFIIDELIKYNQESINLLFSVLNDEQQQLTGLALELKGEEL